MADDPLKSYLKQQGLVRGEPEGPAQARDRTEVHATPTSPSNAPANTPAADARETSGSLITLPHSVALMLDLRLKTGHRIAVPYGYIIRVMLDPSGSIEVNTADGPIAIDGRNLTPVYRALLNHTALAVVESPTGFDEDGTEPFVESIRIEPDPDSSEDELNKPSILKRKH
ncbi:MAG: hypothetical protein AAF356_11670 [Planctomycetota bacterium]